ncbi:type IV pilus modification PilV family protein [Dyella sp. 20L07]|uniref:type IV pilus modification PilV family protein n=1 Tax=Dyella sp. 20L07 TaxID=3384240 RepID=UPI003D2B8028
MLDALIAIVIFSIGIVGMVSLQSAAVNMASNAKYRSDAAMMAEQVIGQMWASDNNPLDGNLATNFKSPAGASYKTWASTVTTITASGGLPGAAAKPPTITVDANNYVTVTIFWQAPSDSSAHQYVTTTQIQP